MSEATGISSFPPDVFEVNGLILTVPCGARVGFVVDLPVNSVKLEVKK